MLNEYQESKYVSFWEAIRNHKNLVFDAKDRAVGKTYLINELGLELQALGYQVFIITPINCIEYYAERNLSLSSDDYRGRLKDNTVVLLDEVFVSENLSDFIDYCGDRQVPVIGFVRYPVSRTISVEDFKKEYECIWFN